MSKDINLACMLRNMASKLKVPVQFGQILSFIPYELRPGIGRIYRKRKQEIKAYNALDREQRKVWIFKKMYAIVDYAINKVEFYKNIYASMGFTIEQLKRFDDIQRIPVVNKQMLQQYDIELRSNYRYGRYTVNTGGSSGNALSFYVQPELMGNEWAHMHTIWSALGYVPNKLKLGFGGRNSIQQYIQYDFLRHSLDINIYSDFYKVSLALKKMVRRHQVYYLHGYPSAIYEFALFCKNNDEELQVMLKKSLKGAFLGSEYPLLKYRETIENVFGISSISWYGHTERSILAYEKNCKYCYVPFQTYGYVEAQKIDQDFPNLIGTSYYNFASPFIRYDTEDHLTDTVVTAGILEEFQISDGRHGQFIVDSNGKKIALTGLIFGRHHKLFDYCSHIQVYQNRSGFAVIVYVQNNEKKIENPILLFDSKNVDIDFKFLRVSSAIKTKSGKVNLLLDINALSENDLASL